MKTLSSYINECLLNEEKGDGNFFKKTRTTILLQDNLKNFLKHLRENSISLENKTELKKVYNAYTMYNLKNGFLSGESFKNAVKEFKLDTAVGFAKFLYDNTQELKDTGYNVDAFKDFNLSKNELAYKKWEKSQDYTPGKYHDDANLRGLDNHRIMVVYSRYNPSLHDEYDYTGAVKSNSNQIHMLRMKFHYDYGVKYYECYNCLLDTYMKKSKEELEHQDMDDEQFDEHLNESAKSFEDEVKKFAKKYSLKVLYSSENFAEVSGREPDIEDAFDGWDSGRDLEDLDVMVSDKSATRMELELMK